MSSSSEGRGSSRRDELHEVVGEAAIASAVSHVADHVLSPEGAPTRRWLVRDAVAAAEAVGKREVERARGVGGVQGKQQLASDPEVRGFV